MRPIIILNAPPRTGKDTIARELIKRDEFNQRQLIQFKTPMFEIAAKTMSMYLEEFMEKYEGDEGWKDTPMPELQGATVRHLLIHISENFIKPFFGPNYFGDKAAYEINRTEEHTSDMTWIFPDGGFQAEVDMLTAQFPGRVYVIQLTREGHTNFSNDSRSWVFGDKTVMMDTTEGNDKVIEYIESLIK